MNMQKIKRICKLVVITMAIVSCLTGCALGLNGTYKADGLIEQSFTFMEDNTVKLSAFGLDVEGTYVIEDGKLIITYSVLGLSYDWEQAYERVDKDTISIGGTLFNKVD